MFQTIKSIGDDLLFTEAGHLEARQQDGGRYAPRRDTPSDDPGLFSFLNVVCADVFQIHVLLTFISKHSFFISRMQE